MNNEIKKLLESPDPEINFLGLMMINDNSVLNLENITLVRKCVYKIRGLYPNKFKEIKNNLEDIIFRLYPNYFWLIFDGTEYYSDYNPNDYKII